MPEFKFMNVADMKFHLYRSVAKIDSLFRQIQEPDKKAKLKWKVDVKVVSIERETESEATVGDEEKLRTVVQELEARELIGELDDDKPYVRGIVPMKWGIYEDHGMRPSNQGPFVYFGSVENDILLGLGGSSHHVEGWYGVTATGSRSSAPALVDFLHSGVENGECPLRYQYLGDDYLEQVYDAMAIATHYLMNGPIQSLEFVAKVLCRAEQRRLRPWRDERGKVILATPLYVCQVDPMSVDG